MGKCANQVSVREALVFAMGHQNSTVQHGGTQYNAKLLTIVRLQSTAKLPSCYTLHKTCQLSQRKGSGVRAFSEEPKAVGFIALLTYVVPRLHGERRDAGGEPQQGPGIQDAV